ncbi:IclR family transcriptional regulator [Xylophilus sp.]|uniref:IclR family transcriptional regulator n=1 Tax=Xylophilus sp. TaxID=2653893 RepID=UPI0013B794A9|nr:IclR family transcriptional regulator [Xylophilus sp.]KAF1044157.1 MAG: Pectin degradation repressor protein KdgR [Xylophilus sp.]
MSDESGVAAVDRALQILAVFRADDYSLSLVQLAERTMLHKSTIIRLCESLIKAGYLVRIPDGSYQVGAKPLQLGAIFQRQFRTVEHVPPVLRELVASLNESASFYVPAGEGRICLHRVDARRMIRDAVKEGDWRPLGNGAAGTIILAFRGEKGAAFARARKEYWASSFGNEVDPELAAFSVPTFGLGSKLIGALSISGPGHRLQALGKSVLVPLLLDAARRLTMTFGGDSSVFPQS